MGRFRAGNQYQDDDFQTLLIVFDGIAGREGRRQSSHGATTGSFQGIPAGW